MNTSDVIVIGGGLAGLIAANVAARNGQSVTVITYGSGSFPLFSGAFDFFGRNADGKFVTVPAAGINSLPASHPYKKIKLGYLREASIFLHRLFVNYHMHYAGTMANQIPVVTAAGTLKYSTYVPLPMDASTLDEAEKIFVVGVKGLKDFYADMIAANLKNFVQKEITAVEIDLNFLGGRDINSYDAAQFLDDDAVAKNLIRQLKNLGSGGDVAFILPPILGSENHSVYDEVRFRVNAKIFETTCLPPSPAGMRLQKVLVKSLQDSGAKIFENTKVLRAVREHDKISGVFVQTATREKIYRAEKIILATGGFFGGGIVMKNFNQPKETVLDLPVYFDAENWSNEEIFSASPQGFAKTGILVDENLSPLDVKGFENVRVVGNSIGGADFIFERSLGGIALASAYKAAMV